MPVNVSAPTEFIVTDPDTPSALNPVPTHKIAEPVTFKLVSGVVFPIPPDKVTAPVALRVRSLPPLTVPPKEIGPEVVVIILDAGSTVGTALVTMNEVAVILAPRVTVFAVPAAEDTVIAPRGALPPTMPPKVTAPAAPALRVRACAFAASPLTAPPKEIPEDPVVVIVVKAGDSTVGTEPAMLKEAALIAETLAPRVTALAAGTAIAPRAIELPTRPLKVTAPPTALRVRFCP